MRTVVFSPKARQDLIDIGDHIAKDSQTDARRFVARLIDQCQRIERVLHGARHLPMPFGGAGRSGA